ncbi:MAG TPA: UDP-3-O-(3-hydroxymyristoyl)glucosamine N-acyltransferase [Bacteroidetes bacterium]|nr:UDP-3-O-(3-hydroxymyristoyl)glucosamine N-acyltransferase [Bacteroidota bacterium]
MKFTTKEIAQYINGDIEGDPGIIIDSVARIEEGHKGALSFLSNMNYEKYLYTTGSSAVIVNRDFRPASPVKATLIRVDNSYEAFAALLTVYEQSKPRKKGIHPTAVIESTAKLGKDVYVGPMAYVGENVILGDRCAVYPHARIGDNCRLGNDTMIYPGVTVYHECIIGNNCTVHAGSVIGSDGFGFAPQSGENYKKIPQIGNVILEDNVEIGANVVVDRATMGSTVIRKGVKLDNLIQIGHNVEVGENTVMAGQTGIAGSTKIGRNCMFGGQVGITGHVKIADGTKAAAKSGVNSNILKENTTVYGSPAFEYRKAQLSWIIFRRLPELKQQVERLEEEIKEIKNR